MTQPHKKLAARASRLSMQLWQGVDWETRVAHLCLRLAGTMPGNWGEAIFEQFRKAGVEDVPEGRREARDWGEYVFASLKRKGLKDETIEDLMQDLIMEVIAGSRKLKSLPLSSAKSWVMNGLQRKGIDLFRRNKKRDVGLPMDDEGVQRDVKDVRSWGQLSSMLNPRTIKAILRELPRVNERAVEWFEMVMNGLQNNEIAEAWGVSRSRVSAWQRKFVPKIKAIVEKYIDPEGLRMAI